MKIIRAPQSTIGIMNMMRTSSLLFSAITAYKEHRGYHHIRACRRSAPLQCLKRALGREIVQA